MDIIIQLLVVLAIFGIAVSNAIKKEKKRLLLEQSKKNVEPFPEGWFDEMTDELDLPSNLDLPSATDQKKSMPSRKNLKPTVFHSSIEGVSTPLQELDDSELEVETFVDVTSHEEIRKGIIWSEILKRKYS